MNTDQKTRITRLRSEGASYNQIAQKLGISKNTVSTFCRRNGLTGDTAESAPSTVTTHTCKNCGKEIIQYPGRKEKKFCSDACRNKWWSAHLSEVKRRARYPYTCPSCGKMFYAYGNRNRKYCSHACYIAGRFGGA